MNFTRFWTFLAAIVVLASIAPAQTAPADLHYNFRAGDHLVYRETFDRSVRSDKSSIHLRFAYMNHLIVVAEEGGTALVGIQRHRESADMLEYRDEGKDVLQQQWPKFVVTTAKRPVDFTDAVVYTAKGEPQVFLQTVREANSKLLYLLGEINPLPGKSVQAGDTWVDERFGTKMRLAAFEQKGDDNCARIEDDGSRKEAHLRFTFCPKSGAVTKLEFEGEYPGFGNQRFHDSLTLELVEARRGEQPASWFADPLARLALLRAEMLTKGELADKAAIEALAGNDAPAVQSLALAVLLHHDTKPPAELLSKAAQSTDAEVRRIASRFEALKAKANSATCELPARNYPPQVPGTTLRFMESEKFRGALYMMRVPIDYLPTRPTPLIIYLSGGGGQAIDAASTAEDALRHTEYLALYPSANGGLWWEQRPTETVAALLPEVLRNFNVDTNRVYLSGASNGGTGSTYFGTLWAERFAAIAPLMGAGMFDPSDEKVQWPMTNLLNVPMLFLHGDSDPIVENRASIATTEELKKLGPRVAPELHILKKRGHDLSLSSEESYVMPFLARHERNLFPKSISAHVSGSLDRRQYWLQVDEAKGPAEIEGRIGDDNTVEIKARNVRKLRVLLRPELFSKPGEIRVRVNGRDYFRGALQNDCKLFAQSAEEWSDPFLAYTQEVVVELGK